MSTGCPNRQFMFFPNQNIKDSHKKFSSDSNFIKKEKKKIKV